MKAGWINGLRIFTAFALLMGGGRASACFAQENQATPPANPLNATEPNVVAVRIVNEEGTVLSETPSGLAVQTGKPLSRTDISQSLRTLYRTGSYADIKAATTPAGDGVRLDFVVRDNFFFNQVLIDGLKAPPSDASAAAAMQLTLGQTYRRDVVDEAVERLRETLRDEGLYQAVVATENVPHPNEHQMDVLVHVKPGPRARVREVTIQNATEYGNGELLPRLKIKAGTEVTSARVQRGTDRIRKYLVKKGHLSARASVRRGEYDATKNTIPLLLDVTAGPRVTVAVTGAKFSNSDLKKLLPIYQEGAVDADLLEEGKRNIRERLERNGFFDAGVDYATQTREVKGTKRMETEEVITYTVQRGDQHKLVGIDFTGNHYFNTELLRSRLQIFGGAFASRGRFSKKLIDNDAQSIQGLYLTNGFLDAKVTAKTEDNYQGKTGLLFVHFLVEEGKQTKVASLAIEGNHAFTEDELMSVIGSAPGQPYSDYGVTTDRDNILALYFNEGFPEAQFSAKATPVTETENEAKPPATDPKAEAKQEAQKREKEKQVRAQAAPPVKLVYHIDEGPQTRVRRVLLAGYNHTRPGAIRREVKVKPGEPLRQGDVVESQRRLYNLGIFNRVTIEPQNPNGTDSDKDIVVLVEEAKRYTIAYGGGFEVQRLASSTNPTGGEVQAAPRGIFEITKNNLTGRGDSLSLKLRGSTLQGRALLGYSAPNAFASPKFSFQATAFFEKTQDINTFTETRYEGSLQLTDQVTRLTTILYRYSFRKVLVSNLNSHIAPEEIPLFEQPTLVSQFGVTWFRDSRNNPADATKGSFNSADFSIADTGIGSSASFLRFSLQNSTYYPIKRRFSFARSIRFGILQPYRDTVSLSFPEPNTTPPPTIIPLPERFFAGGGTSLRGFALNQAGPRDSTTGFPIGGQALLILNQEFRFPMRLPFFGTQLGGALFYDGGNVYSRLSRISFRSTLPKPVFATSPSTAVAGTTPEPEGIIVPAIRCIQNCSNELNYFSHTVGFGLRYATPVGPIRIDMGYQLNRPDFVIPCTTNPTNCYKITRLPGFQIFFNLGSSF